MVVTGSEKVNEKNECMNFSECGRRDCTPLHRWAQREDGGRRQRQILHSIGHNNICYDCAALVYHNESENMPPPPKCPFCREEITQYIMTDLKYDR